MSCSDIIPDSASIDSCIGCGGCVGRCFLLEAMPGMNPRRLVRLSMLGEEQQIRDSEFLWACTLCIRCTQDCPAGVRMDQVTRSLRGRMTADGQAPEELRQGIAVSLEMGNNSSISKEDFIDTIEWLEEELQEETGDETATIPIDVVGARVLFVPNPREILYLPMLLTASAQVLRAAKESWTVSSNTYDITNWAYYTGDPESTMAITRKIIDEAHRLQVDVILSTECGHGYKILREDARQWFGDHHRFEVVSLAETFASYLDTQQITLDPTRQTQKITYHDPCNLARKAGVIEEPRRVLRAAANDFVDMQPSGLHNWCCGGGGGVGHIGKQTPTRLKAGARKADQIKSTGADVLVTSCQNCFQQLTDLKKEYDLGVEIKTLAQIVAASLVD